MVGPNLSHLFRRSEVRRPLQRSEWTDEEESQLCPPSGRWRTRYRDPRRGRDRQDAGLESRHDVAARGHDEQSGPQDQRRPEQRKGRDPRWFAARRLSVAREDHGLRPRADPGARRPCAGRRRAWRIRMLRGPVRPDHGVALCSGRQEDPGLRAVLDGGRFARVGRYAARRAGVRGEVLHRHRDLGPRRQQHAGVLHQRRDQVPRPHPCGKTRAAHRNPAGGFGA